MRRDAIRVSTTVPFGPAEAFRLFTEEVDRWWRRGERFRERGARLFFEPRVGGRFVEATAAGAEREIGRIRVWEPGKRLVFEWRARSFTGDEHTEVEVRFERSGPERARVSVEHRGFARLPADHPALYRTKGGPDFAGIMGYFWSDLLLSLAAFPAP